jgi:hypothetical protein
MWDRTGGMKAQFEVSKVWILPTVFLVARNMKGVCWRCLLQYFQSRVCLLPGSWRPHINFQTEGIDENMIEQFALASMMFSSPRSDQRRQFHDYS